MTPGRRAARNVRPVCGAGLGGFLVNILDAGFKERGSMGFPQTQGAVHAEYFFSLSGFSSAGVKKPRRGSASHGRKRDWNRDVGGQNGEIADAGLKELNGVSDGLLARRAGVHVELERTVFLFGPDPQGAQDSSA